MARAIKIDNALQKRFSKSRQKSKHREIRVSFLIVCEGAKTEPNYFKSFPKQVGKYVFDIQTDGIGMNTLSLVEKAIELRYNSVQKFDRVWAVFDKDSFPAENFNAAISKAKSNNISCAWSNEAFELWYLLHFQYRNTAMSREEYERAIENEINKTWKNKKKPYKYLKNATDTYEILKEYQEQAIENAEKLSRIYDNEQFATHNLRTQVYELVKQLTGKDEKLNKEIKKNFE